MVFLHGTVIMHESAAGLSREERVRQVVDGDASVHEFGLYIPIGHAVDKLRAWEERGVSIVYLSSHTEGSQVELDKHVLAKHGFPSGPVYYRDGGSSYSEVVDRVDPAILIEDDCESIGGEPEMAYPRLSSAVKRRVQSVVVKEFGGLDHLPDDPALLRPAGDAAD